MPSPRNWTTGRPGSRSRSSSPMTTSSASRRRPSSRMPSPGCWSTTSWSTDERLPKFRAYLAACPALSDSQAMSREKYAESQLGSLQRAGRGGPPACPADGAGKPACGYRPGSPEHRVEPHVLPHLGPLLLVVHQELAIAEVLAFLLALGGDEEPSPCGRWSARRWPRYRFRMPGGRLLAERLDDLVVERDEELGEPGVALPRTTAGELAVDPARLVPLGADDVQAADARRRRRRA